MLTKTELREGRFYIIFLAAMSALGPLSVDVYLPAMPEMAAYFNTDIAIVNLTMSSFLIGNGFGQFFGGALSDQLGRKTIGLIGIILYLLSTLFILQAGSVETIQIYRFTQAIGIGFTSVICLAQVRDLYPKEEVMKRFANVMLIMLLAPLLGPIIGAGLVQFGWHSIFVFLGVWGLIVFFLYLIRVPETIDEKASQFSVKELFVGYIYVTRRRVDGRLIPNRYILFGALSSAIFMTFLINSALIYMQYFSVSEFQFALIFGAHALMLMIGNRAAVKLTDHFSGVKVLRIMNFLQLALTATLLILTLLGYFNLQSVLLFTLLVVGVNGAINPTASGLFIVHFDRNVGSASSLKTTCVFVIGALVGGLAAILSKGELMPIFALMVLCSLAARVILMGIKELSAVNS